MIPFSLRITSGFQVAAYPAGATFGPRRLHDYELVWIIEGDVAYHQDATEFAAPEGSVLLCRPDTTDAFRWDARRRTRHAWFHFMVAGDLPAEWGQPPSWRVVVPPGGDDLLTVLFRRVIAGGPNRGGVPVSPVTQRIAEALFAAFVAGTEPNARSGDLAPALPEPLARAMAFVSARLDEHLAEPLPLSKIAGAACVSPEHLCRLFAAHTGHSPAETVRRLRLDRAAALLARTNYAVGEIAALCGFPSQFHFARRFKEAFGQTPSELRRAIAEGGNAPVSTLVRSR